MRLLLIVLLSFSISLRCKAQRLDSIQIIHKMIIGTWIDVDSPDHIMTISADTVRMDNDCWVYKIKLEKPRNGKVKRGEYWFGFSYHNCNEQLMQYQGNIMTNNTCTYMKYYDDTEDSTLNLAETFVFIRKK